MFRQHAHDEEIKQKDKGNHYCGKQDVCRGVHPPSHEAYPLLSHLLLFLSPSLLSPLSFPFLRLPSLSFSSLPSPNTGYGGLGAL